MPGYTQAAPFSTVAAAKAAENGLADAYYTFLTTGGSGFATTSIDTRIANYGSLLPGVFQLTGPTLTDDDYAGSPVHRFYQMWQQLDCSAARATLWNPSGCASDLWAWVEQTIAAGSNGNPEPPTFKGEGSTALEFYNMQAGDLAYSKALADEYTISDNFHQAVEGGTGAEPRHDDGGRRHLVQRTATATRPCLPRNQIENPDPAPGTNNWYTQDGYSGGTYSECADPTQPGVSRCRGLPRVRSGVVAQLRGRPLLPAQQLHARLLRRRDGQHGHVRHPAVTAPHDRRRRSSSKGISWAYFGDQYDNYLADKNLYDSLANQYCDICNGFQYSSSIMANAAVRTAHIKDTTDLYADIAGGWLPAVSFVKPSGLVDGHPASSKWDLFEGFSKKIIDLVKANPEPLGRHRHLRHGRRGRRLLRLGVRPAGRLLRRRNAHPAHRGLEALAAAATCLTSTPTTSRS